MNKLETVINHIQETDLCVDHTTLSDCVMVSEKFGSYLLQFAVTYETIIKDYLSADYEHPEEADISFNNTNISDVYVYTNNNEIELTETEIETLTDVLYIKLID